MKSLMLSFAVVVASTLNVSAQEATAPLMSPELVKNQAAAAVPANAVVPMIFLAFVAIALSSTDHAAICD